MIQSSVIIRALLVQLRMGLPLTAPNWSTNGELISDRQIGLLERQGYHTVHSYQTRPLGENNALIHSMRTSSDECM